MSESESPVRTKEDPSDQFSTAPRIPPAQFFSEQRGTHIKMRRCERDYEEIPQIFNHLP